jgi:putative FmdB family regulatory protein
MPNYAYKCGECGKEWEAFHFIDDRNNEYCCNEEAIRMISNFTGGIHVFKPFISQEMDVNDVEITSKRQYKNELKKRGLSCRAF